MKSFLCGLFMMPLFLLLASPLPVAFAEDPPSTPTDGVHSIERPDGSREEVPMQDGRIHGIYRRYASDGTLLSENEFQKGLRHGTSRAYTSRGEMIYEINLKKGRAHGEAKQFYRSGAIRKEAFFYNDVLHGPERIYYDTGQLREERVYKKGKQVGKSIRYDRDGNVMTD